MRSWDSKNQNFCGAEQQHQVAFSVCFVRWLRNNLPTYDLDICPNFRRFFLWYLSSVINFSSLEIPWVHAPWAMHGQCLIVGKSNNTANLNKAALDLGWAWQQAFTTSPSANFMQPWNPKGLGSGSKIAGWWLVISIIQPTSAEPSWSFAKNGNNCSAPPTTY